MKTEQVFIEFSYDGCGVNDTDEYRSRLATITDHGNKRNIGPLLAASLTLLEACQAALPILEYRHRHGDDSNDEEDAYAIVKAAIAKALPNSGQSGTGKDL